MSDKAPEAESSCTDGVIMIGSGGAASLQDAFKSFQRERVRDFKRRAMVQRMARAKRSERTEGEKDRLRQLFIDTVRPRRSARCAVTDAGWCRR